MGFDGTISITIITAVHLRRIEVVSLSQQSARILWLAMIWGCGKMNGAAQNQLAQRTDEFSLNKSISKGCSLFFTIGDIAVLIKMRYNQSWFIMR